MPSRRKNRQGAWVPSAASGAASAASRAASAASGAEPEMEVAYDIHLARRWVAWRKKYPVRARGAIRRPRAAREAGPEGVVRLYKVERYGQDRTGMVEDAVPRGP